MILSLPEYYRKSSFAVIKIFGALLGVFLLLPTFFYEPIRSGIDSSWEIALHYAFQNGFIFGKDFIYTYGPLGVVSTRLPFEGMRGILMVSDLFLYSSILFAFIYATTQISTYAELAFLILAAFSCGECIYRWDLAFVIAVLSLFFLFLHIKNQSWLALAFSYAHGILALFIKVNMGLTISVVIISALGVLSFRSMLWRRYIAALIGFIASIFIFSIILHVDLIPYLKGAVHISNSYIDIMFLKPNEFHILSVAALVLLSFGCTLLTRYKALLASKRDAIIALSSLLILTVLFKQSFVRADSHHTKVFLFYSALPIGLVILFGSDFLKQPMRALFAITVVFNFSYQIKNFHPGYLAHRWLGLQSYFDEMLSSELPPPITKNQALLSPPAIKFIGDRTVDFIPWELSYIRFYHLNYKPRPIIQSFIALDEYLDRLNAARYMSPEGPQAVLFSINAIDDRYCFFDEPRLKDSLLTDYEVIDRDGEYLMMQKRPVPLRLEEQMLENGEWKLNKNMKLPEVANDKLIYLKARIPYSLRGRFMRTIFQPPELLLRFQLKDKSQIFKRVMIPSLENGVLVNRYIPSTLQAEYFYRGKFDQLPQVESIKIYTDEVSGFRRRYNYTLFTKRIIP